ncbi:MAG: AMP-binding protein [Aquabacterium sp.]
MDSTLSSLYPDAVPPVLPAQRPASLCALLDDALQRHAKQTAYRCQGASLTFAQVDEAAAALTGWLLQQGLQRGERVALLLPNLPQVPVAALAVWRAGGVLVRLNPQADPALLQQQLADSGTRIVLVLDALAARLAPLREELPLLRHVVVCSVGDLLGPLRGAWVNFARWHLQRAVPRHALVGAVAFRHALARGRSRPAMPLPAPPGADDLAVLQHTGGTTGAPRTVELLHRNLVANVMQCAAWVSPALSMIRSGEQPGMVCALPLHHAFAFTVCLLLGLHLGCCVVLIPDGRDTAALLKTLATERFHWLPGVNSLFSALLHHPAFDSVDWSMLRLSVAGGAAVQHAVARQWLERTGCPLCEAYGLAEASPAVTCNPVDATGFSGAAGLPLPGTELQIIDDVGLALPDGMVGEIAVRGPQLAAGYWQRPHDTARAMTTQGFLRTGDVGRIDEYGYLHVIDRRCDVIRVGGLPVYPSEIEDVIVSMPGVREAGVVGRQAPEGGDQVVAVVVRQDPSLDEAAVLHWCADHLTGYKRPRQVLFRDTLPKSAVGKVLRRELRA